MCHRQLLCSGPDEDDDDEDDDDGFSDFPAAPDEHVDDFEYTDESLLLTYLECKFVLPFKSKSLQQSAFVTVEVSVDTLFDRGIEAVLLFCLLSEFPNF